jgi:ATP-dependent helicase HrpB
LNSLPLPIDPHLPSILNALRQSPTLVLEAPPGTGKTTRVAPAMMDSGDFPGQIALIQPRRIAARAAAVRIAGERGVALGQSVGYQVRFDHRCSDSTKLISMTPGILLRKLQVDPILERFSAVVLDEFHERSLDVDLLLGMIRQIQTELRPELRLVLMSATLDFQGELLPYLNHPPMIQVSAERYPVDIRWTRCDSSARPNHRSSGPSRRIVDLAIQSAQQAISNHEGDVLVFLPGVGEIMQVRRGLEGIVSLQGVELLTLYGDLPPQEQDTVLSRGPRRRIILSTNIAETSLTIEGIRIVIDSGWARVKRMDVATGLDALRLEPISKASAVQRSGRAGRTGPGIALRLWDETTHRGRPDHLEPEVLRTDLASAVLQLLSWNEEPEKFPWLTPPQESSLSQARRSLELIGAIQGSRVTEMGKLLLQFPVHPRLARLMIDCQRLGIPATGARAAALLSERDLFLRAESTDIRRPPKSPGKRALVMHWDCDLTQRLVVWNQFTSDGNPETDLGVINRSAERHLSQVSQQFQQMLQAEFGSLVEDHSGDCLRKSLLAAFPDRVAKRRSATSSKGLMVGGKGVQLDSASGVREELFLCLDVSADRADARVRLASGIRREWLGEEWLRSVDERFFNPTQQAVVVRRRTYWIDLLLEEHPVETPLDDQTAQLLAREAARSFDKLLPAKDKQVWSLLGRLRWLSESMPDADLPKFDRESLSEQLRPWCVGRRSMAELKELPWQAFLQSLLSGPQRQLLEQQAPESIELPSGRLVMLQYEPGRPPVLAARIQELFGWKSSPRLAGGKVPLLLHLLAPNQRCQQITDDLAGFWKNTYPTVRKELRGRYPKHDWPENPVAD